MKQKQVHVAHGTHISFSHKLIWSAVQSHLRLADANPDDSWSLHLSAALLSAAAFEAYLNYVGQEVLPQIWDDEKTFFSKPPYRGTMGKLARIAEDIGWTVPPKGRKPYSGVVELQNLRSRIVHARSKRQSFAVSYRSDKTPRLPPGWLADDITPRRVRSLIADVENLLVALHAALRSSEVRNVVFGAHPLLGAVGVGGYFVEQ